MYGYFFSVLAGTGGDESAGFAFLNFGKHGVVRDPEALLRTADVCIASPGAPRIDLAAARQANPGLVVAELSRFGRTGPYATDIAAGPLHAVRLGLAGEYAGGWRASPHSCRQAERQPDVLIQSGAYGLGKPRNVRT